MAVEIGTGEAPQVATRKIVLVVAGMLAILTLVAFGFELAFPDRIGTTSVLSHPFPAPAVIPDERSQRLALERRQREKLSGANGRMSIESAMQAIAAKGPGAFDPIGSTR